MGRTEWPRRLALPVDPARDHVRGPVDAPLTLVEYGDYECPFCGAAHPVVEAVRRQLGDDLRFVFRHFPLVTVHAHAWGAAEAAEAAGAQDKFWPMHDLLFADPGHLSVADLLARAIALDLDMDRFEADLRDRIHARKVQEDFLSGVYGGAQGTPTFFVNGARYDGMPDGPGLLAALTAAGAPR
jgi:NhaA family Na+:H+ antiporter